MALQANTTNQSNAVIIAREYSNLPQGLLLYNALSGDFSEHFERADIGWISLSALSAFSIDIRSAVNGISRDFYIRTAQSNSIYLS
jgi:hypothetical protein